MTLSTRAAEIVAAAGDLLEREGAEALTMRRLGEALGIQAPSIYKHLPGKRAVEAALIDETLRDAGAACHAAVDTGPMADVVERLFTVYRTWGLAHPNRYRLATSGRLDRDALTPGLEDWAGSPFWIAAGKDPHMAQAMWSFAHGMLILELDGRYPDGSDLGRTWAAGAAAFSAALRRP